MPSSPLLCPRYRSQHQCACSAAGALGTGTIAPPHSVKRLTPSHLAAPYPPLLFPRFRSQHQCVCSAAGAVGTGTIALSLLLEASTLEAPAVPHPSLLCQRCSQHGHSCAVPFCWRLTTSHPAVPYPPLPCQRYRSQHQCAWLDAQPNRHLGGQQPPAATIHAPNRWVQVAAAWRVPHTIRVWGLKYNGSS